MRKTCPNRRSYRALPAASAARASSSAVAAPALLRGEDVMEVFGVPPGPEVGRLLALAREAQALGLVSTREEALAHLRRGTDPGT